MGTFDIKYDTLKEQKIINFYGGNETKESNLLKLYYNILSLHNFLC